VKITGANISSLDTTTTTNNQDSTSSSSSLNFSAKTRDDDNAFSVTAAGGDLSSASDRGLTMMSNVAVSGCGSMVGERAGTVGAGASGVAATNGAPGTDNAAVASTTEEALQDEGLADGANSLLGNEDDYLDLLMDNFEGGEFDPILEADFDPNLLL
jgi:hypothetical protein